jgi:hypothetical protein
MAERGSVPTDSESLAIIDAEISSAMSTVSQPNELTRAPAPPPRGPLYRWVAGRMAPVVARLLDLGARHGRIPSEDGGVESMVRTGRVVARWISFPRGVRTVTASTGAVAVGLALWGVAAITGPTLLPSVVALTTGLALARASGPIGVRLANRLHGLVARHRRRRISELRAMTDRRAVAVRGVVIAGRTSQSLLDSRAVVWSLTRFRRGRSPIGRALFSGFFRAFFHEKAFDFLLADGTDEPVWVEVNGGMLIDAFPPDARFQFSNSTLLEIDHPFLTDLRVRARQVWASEIAIAAGDVVEVVGRLSRRLDPTAPSDSGREPPQRRVLRSGTRVPVMVRRIVAPDLELSRVRRLSPLGGPDSSSGEPPVRRF